MEERLRLQMTSATRPYDTWVSLKCMAILSGFGICAAFCYPLLWVGMIVICFVKSTQLYAAPLVVLAALGTVYGSSMLTVYYVNTRLGVPLLDMVMGACLAIFGLVLVNISERSKENHWKWLLPEVKYTLTPIATEPWLVMGMTHGKTVFFFVNKEMNDLLVPKGRLLSPDFWAKVFGS